MQTPNVLRERPFPRNRHRQKKRIESRVVKALAQITTGSEDKPLLVIRGSERSVSFLALGSTHSTSKHHNISRGTLETIGKIIEMIAPFRQDERISSGFECRKNIIDDLIVSLLAFCKRGK